MSFGLLLSKWLLECIPNMLCKHKLCSLVYMEIFDKRNYEASLFYVDGVSFSLE